MTTAIKPTSYQTALAKLAKLREAGKLPKVDHVEGLTFKVQSTSNPTEFHIVTLASVEVLHGATCDCSITLCCIHRARAFASVVGFLRTSKGRKWYESVLRFFDWKAGKLSCQMCNGNLQSPETDLCETCQDVHKYELRAS